ncbi:MAG: 3-oxoacyl-ACP reductase [Cellvibrionales bacterium TMED49]|nr:MAG: 3-oxoacyl-ACP reductase [Cellvibrionales bacterium TMED49]OUU38912.1 MAG: 3-oxoacyl-ACP reductase [Cellvibrionales bacterium TMED49]|tara:strand:- start:31 stop:774 length:744 start_codon:yes stop_codon:yes gene_type:complete
MNKKQRNVLVTGANRGIGQAISESFAKEGYNIIGTSTTSEGAEKITLSLKDISPKAIGLQLDFGDGKSIETFIRKLIDEHERVDILINNAGITRDNLALRMSNKEWHDVIDINLNSVFHITRACLRGMMKNRWGRVINISSVIGSIGNSGQINYAASKSGVEGFSRALAQEMGSRNITVNSVAPGFIETDMTQNLPDSHKGAVLEMIPLQRLGTSSEVSDVVKFLASDAASYITGEIFHVNGGMFMR